MKYTWKIMPLSENKINVEYFEDVNCDFTIASKECKNLKEVYQLILEVEDY